MLVQDLDGTLNESTGVRVGVGPVQTAHAADDVDQVNGCPGKRHPEASQAVAGLLRLQTQLLQLLFMLRKRQIVNIKSKSPKNVCWCVCKVNVTHTKAELSNCSL